MKWWWGLLCTGPKRLGLDFYSASSLKWQFADKHVAPLGHIILILRKPVFALCLYCCVLSGEATNTNLIVFGLTRQGLKPTIYHTRGKQTNHYTIDEILWYFMYFIVNDLYYVMKETPIVLTLLKSVGLWEVNLRISGSPLKFCIYVAASNIFQSTILGVL